MDVTSVMVEEGSEGPWALRGLHGGRKVSFSHQGFLWSLKVLRYRHKDRFPSRVTRPHGALGGDWLV